MNLKFNHEKCSGCGVCKLACSIKNFEEVTPSKAVLRIEGLFPEPGLYWCGVMMAPAAGKRVADIVTGKMDNKDNPLRYSRFKEGSFEKGDTFLK
jgi:Fe-S-cluster-containing hydrogenase component 2